MTSRLFFIIGVTAILACHLVAAQAGTNKISLKVNLGGGPVGDFLGEDQVFDLDEDFAKQTAKVPIQNTDQEEVFKTQRFSRDSDFVLRLPVPDGVYTVTLLMAETFQPACRPGGRVFDISLGTPVSGLTKVADSFDLFQNAGCHSAYGKKLDNVISKDGIVIHLGQKQQHPALAGFIVEGVPVPKGDGSEYKAIAKKSDSPESMNGYAMSDPSVNAPSGGDSGGSMDSGASAFGGGVGGAAPGAGFGGMGAQQTGFDNPSPGGMLGGQAGMMGAGDTSMGAMQAPATAFGPPDSANGGVSPDMAPPMRRLLAASTPALHGVALPGLHEPLTRTYGERTRSRARRSRRARSSRRRRVEE